MSVLGSLLGVFVRVAAVCLIITFIPGLPPHLKFEPVSVKPPLPLKGALAVNGKLNNAERLFENEIKGPEALAVYKNELYTTLHGGYVAKISNGKLVPVVKFGKKCESLWEESICGRPLGMKFDKGSLYVCDAYYGVFKVNMTTSKYEQLVLLDTPIEGKVPKLPNSITVASDGTVYWSDSSSTHLLQDGLYASVGNGNGRLIKYDPATKANEVLIENIFFANGVGLTSDESFVVVAETALSRILRYHLKGPKKGTSDVFIEGLPGLPDNIQEDGSGGFYVTLVIPVDEDHPALSQKLGPYPLVRKFIARLLYLVEAPAEFVEKVYPNYYTKRLIHWVGHFESLPIAGGERVTVVRINKQGEIIESLHATDGKIAGISDFLQFNGYYYLGSPFNTYLARVKVN